MSICMFDMYGFDFIFAYNMFLKSIDTWEIYACLICLLLSYVNDVLWNMLMLREIVVYVLHLHVLIFDYLHV